MDPTERWRELVARPEPEVALDEAALLIAAHDHDVDVAQQLRALDALAGDAPGDAGELAARLFGPGGFAGNRVDYADPRNSFLDEVLQRRLGLPITLSVLMIEVGRRAGVSLSGIGMPGHFLVGEGEGPLVGGRAFDVFNGGAVLDADGCRALLAGMLPSLAFRDDFLRPVGTHAILARMLANLVRTSMGSTGPAGTTDASGAVWALRLRLLLPGLAPAERREDARLLGTLGRFEEAALVLEELAGDAPVGEADRDARAAAALRARAN